MLEIFILSIIQGVTEFLPISSSSHLILVSEYLSFEDRGLQIDVSLHIGSFFAVMVYFRKDIINFIINKELFYKILISSFPVIIAGYLLIKFNLIDSIRSIRIIGWTTLIFGILLFISDKCDLSKKIKNNFTYKSAILIGIFQIFSLIPGVSRSGIVITAARFLNFERYDAAKISFLLSIPTLAGVSIYGCYKISYSNNFDFSFLNIYAIILAYCFSYLTIKYFLKFIQNFSLTVFFIYRIILGTILLLIGYL